MKRMNQNHRGEVCGVLEHPRYRSDRKDNKGEAYWARKRGERPARPLVGASLEELERKLKAL